MKAAWSDWLSSFYDSLCRHGLAISKDAFASHCDAFFSREIAAQTDELTVFEHRIKTLCTDLGIGLETGETRRIATLIAGRWQEHVSLDPEALSVLNRLKLHARLALISNFDHPPHVYALISKLGLGALFDAIVVSGDVGVKKPDPAIFNVALNRTRLSPHEVVYVGDTDDDIQGARSAGICPVLIRRSLRNNSDVVSDFRADSVNAGDSSGPGTMDNVQTITKLSELLDIVGQPDDI